MMAPASDQIAQEFGITSSAVIALLTSVFVAAYGAYMHISVTSMLLNSRPSVAFGPLFLGPLSELYGRSRVLQLANLWYLGTCSWLLFNLPFH